MREEPRSEPSPHADMIAEARREAQRAEAGAQATRLAGAARRIDSGELAAVLAEALPGYEVDYEISRGGQAVVLHGVQRGTRRHVAIKVMRGGGWAEPQHRARFDREVQILGQLRHPNIVTILDSGSARGHFFYIMDFIRGAALDEQVRAQRLTPREVADLFRRVCAAVNVAHLRGVVHRDLKPSNVRVDPSGEPHVLDFGLAKTDEFDAFDDSGSSLRTMTGEFVGSLPWASPEQVEGRPDRLDIRTDVYSLGVMLFHALSGEFPYRVDGRLRETLEHICRTEPPRLRTRTSGVDDELDTIVQRCLRKNPEERYQSAGDLGRDLQRYLAGEPIDAKGDSFAYRLRKELQRNRTPFAVLAAFAAVFVLGFFLSLAYWRQAVEARNDEQDQRRQAQRSAEVAEQRAQLAEREAAKSRAVSDFLKEMLTSASPTRGVRHDLTVREAADRAVQRLERGALAPQPEVEAMVRRALGVTYGSLGAIEPAMELFRSAESLLVESRGAEHADTLETRLNLAAVLRSAGERAHAGAIAREVLRIAEARDERLLAAHARLVLAGLARDGGDSAEAESLARAALAALTVDANADPAQVVTAWNDLAIALDDLGRTDDAIAAQREAVAASERFHGRRHAATASTLHNLANFVSRRGQPEECERLLREALEIFIETCGSEHPDVADALNSLGTYLVRTRRPAEAAPLLRQCLELRRRVLPADDPQIAVAINNVALVQYHLGDLDGAAAGFREARARYVTAYGEDHPAVASITNNLGGIDYARGDFRAAIAAMRWVLERQRAKLEADHPDVAQSLYNLGRALVDAGEIAEAEPLLREAITRRAAHAGESHGSIVPAVMALSGVLRLAGELEEADELARTAVMIRESELGNRHPLLAEALSTLVESALARGATDEAVALAEEALWISRQDAPAGARAQPGIHRFNLGRALQAAGRIDEAAVQLAPAAYELVEALPPGHPTVQRALRIAADAHRNRGDEAAAADLETCAAR